MKEALKLALEALEKKAGSWGVGQEALSKAAITAIKEALAQPEAAAVIGIPTTGEYAMGYAEGFNDACKKPEQEPEPDALTVVYMSGVFEGRKLEREACAALAEKTICDTHIPTGINIYGTRAAKAIRARGNT